MVVVEQAVSQTVQRVNDGIRDDFHERFEKIGGIQSRINDVESIRERYGQPDRKMDNLLYLTENKITDLDEQFKKNGLCLFATEDAYNGKVKRSNIGLAVINDFSGRLQKSMLLIEDFESNIKMPEKALATIDTGVIGKIKAFFRKMGTKQPEPAKPDFENANKNLDQYDGICQSVKDYSIENDLLGSMVKFTNDFKRSDNVMINIYEGEIKPMLNKMGLDYQMSQYENVFINSKVYEPNRKQEPSIINPDIEQENEKIEL